MPERLLLYGHDLRPAFSPDGAGSGLGLPQIVVEGVKERLTGGPETYLKTLKAKYFKGTSFEELLTPAFQLFRIGELGFEIPIDRGDKEKFGIQLDTLSALGREDIKLSEEEDTGWDAFDGINIMRAFVAGVYFEQADRKGHPRPHFDTNLIDLWPVRRKDISGVRASSPGLHMYDADAVEEQWAQSNPDFYDGIIALRDELTGHYSARMLNAYKDLPTEFLYKVTPQIRSEWNEHLISYAIRTYVMFGNRPEFLEIPVG